MALQIWLPLTKNSLNYGAHPSNVTESNTSLNTNGKLGSCYSFANSAYLMGTHNLITNDTNEWSFACWMKLNTTTTGQTLFSCRTSTAADGITVFYYGSQWIVDDGVRWQFTPKTTISANRWYHICVVRKKGVGKYLYIDGVLDSSTSTTGTPTIVNTSNYAIGVSQNSGSATGNPLNGYLNDVRFYDHALSVAEIKELAKGLVCHYKLDEFESSDNLIVNGFGELGSENWHFSDRISTTEIPPNLPEIKASFYNANYTANYIPISQNTTYTISGYIKAMDSTTGKTYPRLQAYDIDKKLIRPYQSAQGFNPNTATTLRQPLHKGDTVIYATDLSNWSTAENNYIYAAVFGYANSLGYVYDDLIYTQDTPSFGTSTDKSNIDKTNNTITLLSAFTGKDRPAGTTICQSTDGSSHYYPWGSINVTSITDWVFKTTTFKPYDIPRIKGGCAYVIWSTYGKCYIAGSKLVDNFFNDDKIIDSSGYSNHGTKSGNISISSSTPRYSYSTKFDSGAHINVTLTTGGFGNTYTFSWWGKYSNYSSHMMWGFSNGNRLNLYMSGGNFYWNTGDGNSNPFNVSATTYGDNQWHHFAVTGDGATAKLYIDGVFKANAKTYKGITGTTIYMNGWDSGTNYNFNGQLSDFRLYATCLSADDIKRLYNTPASVSKIGQFLGCEFNEVIE